MSRAPPCRCECRRSTPGPSASATPVADDTICESDCCEHTAPVPENYPAKRSESPDASEPISAAITCSGIRRCSSCWESFARISLVRFCWCLIISALAISAAIWILIPGMQFYRGLSGIDSAVFTSLAISLFKAQYGQGQWGDIGHRRPADWIRGKDRN